MRSWSEIYLPLPVRYLFVNLPEPLASFLIVSELLSTHTDIHFLTVISSSFPFECSFQGSH